MGGFAVTCFGPGVAPEGQRAQARFDGDMLILELGQGREVRVRAADVRLSAGGFDGRQMLLSWSNGAGDWSVLPADPAALERLAGSAPAAFRAEMERWRCSARAARRGLRRTWLVLGVLLASPLLLVLLFLWQSERFAGWVTEGVPVTVERQLGELAFAQFQAGGRLLEEGTAVAAVREIGQRLTAGSVYDYRWYVLADPAVNAFAVPGGHVVVYAGLLLEADSAEEVAGVLAHEVQHVERRHSLRGVVHALGWQALLGLALGDLSGSVWGSMAYELGRLRFGREQEIAADREGLELLRKAQIDPRGMLSFFEKLAAREEAGIELLSTHPSSTERLAMLQQAVREQGGWASRPLPYDWTAIKSELAVTLEQRRR